MYFRYKYFFLFNTVILAENKNLRTLTRLVKNLKPTYPIVSSC